MGRHTGKIKVGLRPRYCTRCGKELDMWDRSNNFEIHKQVGYGSHYDLTTVWIRLCNACFDDMADSCVSSPVVRVEE